MKINLTFNGVNKISILNGWCNVFGEDATRWGRDSCSLKVRKGNSARCSATRCSFAFELESRLLSNPSSSISRLCSLFLVVRFPPSPSFGPLCRKTERLFILFLIKITRSVSWNAHQGAGYRFQFVDELFIHRRKSRFRWSKISRVDETRFNPSD